MKSDYVKRFSFVVFVMLFISSVSNAGWLLRCQRGNWHNTQCVPPGPPPDQGKHGREFTIVNLTNSIAKMALSVDETRLSDPKAFQTNLRRLVGTSDRATLETLSTANRDQINALIDSGQLSGEVVRIRTGLAPR